MTNVDFHPEAEAELVSAARYYDEQAEKLGLDFLSAVELSCQRLSEFPEIGRSFGPRLRRVLVSRFPYALIYRLESGRVTIVAVANLYQRPGYWRDRS